MHFECRAENLKVALNISERVSGKSPALPVLSSVMLNVLKGGVVVSATNLEIGVEVDVKSVVKKEGAAAIPARTLNGYIGLLKDEDNIIIRGEETSLHIDTGKQQTVVRGVDPSEFPPFPQPQYTGSIEFNTTEFLERLKRVLIATTNFNVKQELSSVSFNITDKTVTLASTDSFRLAEEIIEGDSVKIIDVDDDTILVPVRALEELIRILEMQSSEKVVMKISETGILFITNQIKLFSRIIIDGKFPQYNAIIPKKFSTDATVNVRELVNVLRQARVFTGKLNEVKLTPVTGEGIRIQTGSRDVGEFESIIEAEVRGENTSIVLNWRYLNDAINHTTSNAVFIGMNGGQSPLLLRPIDQSGSLHIIMPMKGV